MLQWMGGSRRKVNNARKSTYNRQKQYFEQKKRHRQMLGREIYEVEQDKRVRYNKEPRSLDILSLSNLTSAPRCSFGSNTGDNALKEGSYALKSPASFPSDKSICIQSIQSEETRNQLNSQSEAWKQKKSPVASRPEGKKPTLDCSDKAGDRSEQQEVRTSFNDSILDQHDVKIETTRIPQNYVSVMDLLNDDGYEISSEEKSRQEAHVAFSVEGLGKIGTKTPVHSPRQMIRVSFVEHSSPKDSRWNIGSDSTEKFNFISDEDFRIWLDESPSELFGNLDIISKKLDGSFATDFSTPEFKHCDAFNNSTCKFSPKKDVCNPASRKERTQNDKCGMINKNFLDDGDLDTALKHQSLKINRQNNDFENFYWEDERNVKEVCKRSNISAILNQRKTESSFLLIGRKVMKRASQQWGIEAVQGQSH